MTACRYDLIEALTRQQTLEALNEHFIQALREVSHANDIYLFLTGKHLGDYDCCCASTTHDGSQVATSHKLRTCLLRKLSLHRPILRNLAADGRLTIAIAVQTGTNLLGAVILHEAASDEPIALLRTLCAIYANQYTLINFSLRDSLTGLYNREAFFRLMEKTLEHRLPLSRRETDDPPTQWCFAMMDIDRFKTINDRFGHLFGDEVLLLVAQHMAKTFRDEDQVFRYGGEEFAVAIKNIDLDTAAKVLERFRLSIAAQRIPQVGNVTISIGLTAFKPDGDLSSMIDEADRALYYAKQHGRNRVCVYETLLAEGKLHRSEPATHNVEIFNRRTQREPG